MSEQCELIYITTGKNDNGFPVESRNSTTVYCREKAVTRMEFYEALRSGLTISLVLEIRQEDFRLTEHTQVNGRKAYATKVVYDGAEYDIVRTYRNDKSMIELICK